MMSLAQSIAASVTEHDDRVLGQECLAYAVAREIQTVELRYVVFRDSHTIGGTSYRELPSVTSDHIAFALSMARRGDRVYDRHTFRFVPGTHTLN